MQHNEGHDFFNRTFIANVQKILSSFDNEQEERTFRFSRGQVKADCSKSSDASAPIQLADNIMGLLDDAESEARYGSKSSRKLIIILKKLAALLHFDYQMKTKVLSKLLTLSVNRIKNAYVCFKKGQYDTIFQDKRKLSKSERRLTSVETIAHIKQHIFNKKYIDVAEIKHSLVREQGLVSISPSLIRHVLKHSLNAHFLSLSCLPPEKNTGKNKIYRKFVAELLARYLAESHVVVSVDECSFSSLHQKNRHWIIKEANNVFRMKKKEGAVERDSHSRALSIWRRRILSHVVES